MRGFMAACRGHRVSCNLRGPRCLSFLKNLSRDLEGYDF